MVTMHYTKYGRPISDFILEEEFGSICADIKDSTSFKIMNEYSTENIFSRVLTGIAAGKISHEDVEFLFDGQILRPNKYGALHPWPNGFCDCLTRLAETRLRHQFHRTTA